MSLITFIKDGKYLPKNLKKDIVGRYKTLYQRTILEFLYKICPNGVKVKIGNEVCWGISYKLGGSLDETLGGLEILSKGELSPGRKEEFHEIHRELSELSGKIHRLSISRDKYETIRHVGKRAAKISSSK